MVYSLTELGAGMEHYLDRIFDGFGLKVCLSAIPVTFASHLGGNWHLFEVWFILNIVDLALGAILALKSIDPATGRCRFSKRKIYGWVVKTLTHMLTILLVGIVNVFFKQVVGDMLELEISLVNWFMFILLLTEVASILDGADRLGLPVHPLARSIIAKLRRNTESRIDKVLEEVEIKEGTEE